MERREERRFPKRLTVRFSKRGDPRTFQGFTTNISFGGLFLGTNVSFERGERVRLEVVDRDRGFTVEGEVVRAERVPLAFRQVRQQGVGIRFVSPMELVADLFPATRRGQAPEAGEAAAPPPPEPVEEQEVFIGAGGLVQVRVGSLTELRRLIEQDLAFGGFFVQTSEPLPLDTEVQLEVTAPIPDLPALRARGRVVQSVSGDGGPQGTGRRAGMGLVLEDAAPLLLTLQSALARYL